MGQRGEVEVIALHSRVNATNAFAAVDTVLTVQDPAQGEGGGLFFPSVSAIPPTIAGILDGLSAIWK